MASPAQFPPPGTPEWYRYVEQLLEQHNTDVDRLWKRTPPTPQNIGDDPADPDWEPPSS